MVGGDNLEFLCTSSICIILNTPPNSDCSPILITIPYGKNPSLSLCLSPHTQAQSHIHTFPWPLHTKVPMKATFFSCEISFLSTDCGCVCLREGNVSPVKLDSSISRSTACKRQTGSFSQPDNHTLLTSMSRMSAGTRSPREMYTMSPMTRSRASSSSITPSRILWERGQEGEGGGEEGEKGEDWTVCELHTDFLLGV